MLTSEHMETNQKPMEKNFRTSIYVPRDLHRSFSALMLARGKTVNEFLVGVMRTELSTLEAKGEIGQLIPSSNG